MPTIGPPELIVIFVVILLLFGAKKLPEVAKGMGKSLGELKKAKTEFEREISLDGTGERKEPVKPREASTGDGGSEPS